MTTMIIKEDGTRYFSTGKARLGDGLLYAIALQNDADDPEKVNEFLRKAVAFDTSLPDLEKDIREHKCSNRKIFSNDESFDIGFKCSCGQKWKIKLWDLKSSAVHFPDYKELLVTPEARAKWAKTL